MNRLRSYKAAMSARYRTDRSYKTCIDILVKVIRADRCLEGPDLRAWAYDIDWSDYQVGDFYNRIGSALAAARDLTGESASDLVEEIEYHLGW